MTGSTGCPNRPLNRSTTEIVELEQNFSGPHLGACRGSDLQGDLSTLAILSESVKRGKDRLSPVSDVSSDVSKQTEFVQTALKIRDLESPHFPVLVDPDVSRRRMADPFEVADPDLLERPAFSTENPRLGIRQRLVASD